MLIPYSGALTVVGVYVLEPAIPKILFHRAPSEVEPCLIKKCGLAVRAGGDDHHRGCVGKASEMLLTLPQRPFNALALAQRPGEPKHYAHREHQTSDGPAYPVKPLFFREPLIRCP